MWLKGRTASTGPTRFKSKRLIPAPVVRHVRNRRELLPERRDRLQLRSARQLRVPLDAAVRDRREVHDRVAEDLVVSDDGQDVVGRIRVVPKSPISRTVPVTPPMVTKSPILNGPQDDHERTRRKVAEQPHHAMPIATPAAANSAANDVVWTPK